jgi:hypothetical protein
MKSSRLAILVLLISGFVVLALSTISAGPRGHRARGLRSEKVQPKPAAPDANPGSGTLNPTGPTQTWTGTVGAANIVDETSCLEGVSCDTYTLILSGTPNNWTGKKAHIEISWNFTIGDDFDVVVHKGASTDMAGRPNGPIVGSAISSSTTEPEVVDIDPNSPSVGTGIFKVHVIYFLALPADTYNGSASAVTIGGGTPTPTPTPGGTPSPTPGAAGAPRYFTYAAPNGTGEDAGEPSIGSNWQSENVVRAPGQTFANSNGTIFNGGTANYYGGFLSEMLRITFDDCSSPAKDLWEKKPLFLAATPRAVGDPILFTDHTTGRTFVTQEESQAGATTDVTDNDGDTFQPSQGAGVPAGFDHETIGGGPYAVPTPNPTPSYPHAIYYASQSVGDASMSRSDDGGITFGPAIPMFTVNDCDGLHGHIKVAPDGTVYLPDKGCAVNGVPILLGGNATAVVSENNGLSWSLRPIPDAPTTGEWDPSIGVATDGTVYLGYQGSASYGGGLTGTPPRIAVSHNKGVTWSASVDLGNNSATVSGVPAEGIKHCVFPEVVAGDPNRAAFAFYGTSTPDGPTEDHTGGTNNDPTLFTGNWYLYVATTFDGGTTWTVQNVTPNDPVQRGPICGDSTCRNLLDFFDATIDKRGRVLVGWEDGCIGGCVNGLPNSFTAKATISRQSGGKRMFAAYDPIEPTLAGAPKVSGYLNAAHTAIELSWPVPDNGGSFITAYKIYRRVAPAPIFTLIATTNVPSYRDSAGFDVDVTKDFYHVTAVNSSGAGGSATEGPYCGDFVPSAVPPPTPCVLPGLKPIDDINADGSDHDSGQNTPVDGSVNVKQLFVAEPFVNGAEKLYFTLQVAPSTLGSAPPNSQWFIIWNRQGTPGSADPGDPDDAKYDRAYIAMRTDANGAPSFEYGKFGIPINTSPPPPPDPLSNTPKKVGDADSGSSYNPLTGEIRIIVSNSKFRAFEGGATKYNAGSGLAGLNVRTYFNRPDPGQRSQNNASDITDDSSYILVGNAFCAPAAQLVDAVSRKVHGAAGPFDIHLVPPGIDDAVECRTGLVPGEHKIILTFAAPVTFSSVSTSAGSAAASTNGNIVTVDLTGIPNPSTVTVTLVGASAGGPAADVPVVMRALLGDVSANRAVNSSDVSEVQAESGHTIIFDNFRDDITTNGEINSSDVSTAQAQSGTGL